MLNSKNGIIGLAIGDAMGVPLESFRREMLMQNPITTMIGYGMHYLPKGSWSDDTSMTLATIDSVIEKNEIDTGDIASRFIEWFRNAKYTPTNEMFGIGRTTLKALARCEQDIPSAELAGGDTEMDNGNGSLMRMLPIAYYCYAKNFKNQKIYETVKAVSSITHRHEISIMGCYIYVCYAIELLKCSTKNKAYKTIQNLDYSMFCQDTINRYSRILTKDISKENLEDISSKGYVVSTLEATFWVLLNTSNYNQSIIGAINLGDDTDTVGACVGGLAGIIYGIEEINPDWKIDLIKYNYIKELCEKFDTILESQTGTKEKVYNQNKAIEKIEIVFGDITEMEVDCIINAAKVTLQGGSGVDGAIHAKAGIELLEKCKELNGCNIGEAKITRGYNLKAQYIIHTVAPKWFDNKTKNKEELLSNCYENSLKLAKDFGIKTIAFPCIGMGAYQIPLEIGAKISIDKVMQFAEYFEKIYLVCFKKTEYEYYCKLVNE